MRVASAHAFTADVLTLCTRIPFTVDTKNENRHKNYPHHNKKRQSAEAVAVEARSEAEFSRTFCALLFLLGIERGHTGVTNDTAPTQLPAQVAITEQIDCFNLIKCTYCPPN